jgi:hypothetical protein
MYSPSKAMGLIVGIAATAAIVGAALPASAAGHDASKRGGPSAPAKGTGPAVTPGSQVGAPSARQGDKSTGNGLRPLRAEACYAYSDGTGDLCLWYLQSYAGSRGGFYNNDANLNDDVFVTAGSGQYSHIGNNAESVWNYDHYWTAWLATSPNFTGSIGYVKPYTGGNLSSTYKNNTESFYWTS